VQQPEDCSLLLLEWENDDLILAGRKLKTILKEFFLVPIHYSFTIHKEKW
jgi:hypothetical protein